MTRLKKWIPWLIINLVLFGSLYIGHFQGATGFMSVFWFMVWALITLIFCLWCSPQAMKVVQTSPAQIPLWLILCLDSSILFFIVWNHHMVTGAFWLLHMIVLADIHKRIKARNV